MVLLVGKASVKEDINKRISCFNKTNLKTMHPLVRIIFESKGNEFHPHNIVRYYRHVNQRTHHLKLMSKKIRFFKANKSRNHDNIIQIKLKFHILRDKREVKT